MMSYGINKGLVTRSDTKTSGFYAFRKMFWKFLKKLNVPFYDPCCEEASDTGVLPMGYLDGQRVVYNGTDWVSEANMTSTTTTTTV